MKKLMFPLLVLLALMCKDPSSSNGPAEVTINYYVGTDTASSATIDVNGEYYTYVTKNSTKVINVETGDNLRAGWTTTTGTVTIPHTKTTTASDGLEWTL